MHPDWQSLLDQAGARIVNDTTQHFGNPAQERQIALTDEIISDLSHLPMLRAHGTDAEKFLQGQFTNDMRLVTDGQSQLSGYCSPKGRTLAITRFFRREGNYCFTLPTALVESTMSRLRKYVLMSKVSLETVDDFVHIGYADPRGGAHLRDVLGGELPAAAGGVVHVDGISVVRLDASARFEIFGAIDYMRTLWQTLSAHAAPVGAGVWEYLDILAGLPCIYPETTDAFVPQMLNLDLLGGINFKKGCYTGQEVVARTHYLGKLKRRMYRLHCDAAPPTPGTALFNTSMRADESAGTVVRAQIAPEGGSALLAVLQIEATASGSLRLGALDGPSCEVKPLPYSLQPEAG